LKFSNSYIDLGEQFFQRVLPEQVSAPKLLLWNNALANSLFISEEQQENHALLSQLFSGNQLPEGAESIALAYSGHQFGHFNPQLGDGRAHLLGEVVDSNNILRDIQLKGSGQTGFSRRGDGKCALAPALREYIMSEALYALGVPTSRCLAVVSTGDTIYRTGPKPGAVVTRVAASHIRVGTFQYFAARGNAEALKSLTNYTIARHFPQINTPISGESVGGSELSLEARVLLFLEYSIDKQITLIVEWLRIGFIHGVMNTDNTAICGETIDFGPCAMMGNYDENTVFSSIDERGRYAFGNQGSIGQWNMARLADCLLLLLIDSNDEQYSEEEKEQQAISKVEAVIHQYKRKFDDAYYTMYANKLGLNEATIANRALIDDLLKLMKEESLDYTQTFSYLTDALTDNTKENTLDGKLGTWYKAWTAMLEEVGVARQDANSLMARKNPVVIPRNHHVEALLERCELVASNNMNQSITNDDNMITDILGEFLKVLGSPYQSIPATKNYQSAPEDGDRFYQTFCGT
jgi:uncharacterized protein YdiU (UPF0061 family)